MSLQLSSMEQLFFLERDPGKSVTFCFSVELYEEVNPARLKEAAEIAAVNSDAHGGVLTPVDYTEVKNVKKPAGGRPGLVIYHTNKTAYVTPDTEKIEKMKQQRTKV